MEQGGSRNWDLHLAPYQAIPAQNGSDLTVGDVIPGPKWSGVRELLNEWNGWREYDYIWLPDDDIYANQGSINRLFEVARGVGLDLFAPALHETSYYAHFSTMRNSSFHGRWVGFVEIMAPGFSRAALEELLPTLDLTETGWGWGLDSLWPKLLDYRNVGIVDGAPVIHTRPVGQMREADLARRVHAESDAIFARYDCQQVHSTLAAFGPELTALERTPDRLLVELVNGWQYIIDRDPRVLGWIADFQKPRFSWPSYPVEGTPS
jgi:hypothetical protein